MMVTKKVKEEEKIHSQEKFARENFAGMDDLGKEIKKVADEARKNFAQFYKAKKEDKTDEFYEKWYALKDETSKRLDILFTVLTIKMGTSIGHALNGGSTKTLKDIIRFMDKYGFGDKLYKGDMIKVANTRHVSSDSFIDVCAVIAAQSDDLDFIKELEAFAAKNEGRENIYRDILNNGNSDIGDMDTYRLTKVRAIDRIAFEALVNGSEKVYDYYVTTGTLKKEYIMRYIEAKDGWTGIKRLTKDEVRNLLKLEPGFINDIIEQMPENLPQEITDIFIF